MRAERTDNFGRTICGVCDGVKRIEFRGTVTPCVCAEPEEWTVACVRCGRQHSGRDLADKATLLCEDCAPGSPRIAALIDDCEQFPVAWRFRRLRAALSPQLSELAVSPERSEGPEGDCVLRATLTGGRE